MKSKKLISLLCAAAMTTSVFAGMVTTASAADDVYTFTDGSTTGWTIDNGGSVSTSDTTGDDTDPYLVIKGGGAGTRAASFTLPKATGSQYVVEFDSLIHGSDGMNNDSHYTQLAFGPAAMANPVESGYAVMMNAFRTNRTGIYVNGGEEAYDVQDKWTRTRIEVDGTSAKITMIDKSGTIIDEDEYTISASNVAKISARVARGDGPTPGDGADPGYVFLDNVHIYNGTAEGALTADGLRGEAAVATPYPEPETKVAAPALVVPEGITPVVDQNFSASFNQAMGAEEATYTDLTGLSIHFGGRSDNGADGDPATYAATSEYAKGDKTLELTGGRYSNQGRGPRVWATEKLSPSGDNSAVMAFAANLTSLVAGGAGRLYILGTDLQAGDTKDGAYNQVMAVLATDDYEYSEGEGDSLVIKVDPYTWYKVGVVVSGDKYRVYVAEAGEAWPTSAQIQRDHVGQGASSIGAVDLTTPYLAVTSADSKGGTTNPNVRIDNLLAYTGSAEEPRYLLPSEGEVVEPTPGAVEMHKVSIADSADGTKVTIKDIDGAEEDAYDGVFIHAKYADGRLTSVKSYPAKGITAAGIDVTVAADDAIALGDTLMVWSGLDTMVPYGKDTAKNSSVKEYAVKIGSLTGGSVVAKPANAEEGATVELTVTANDGYEYVDGSLKVMNGTTEVAVTAADGKYTFTMPAADVTVTAEFKAKATPKPTDDASATKAPVTSTQPSTNAPATNAPATNAPATNAPATNAPATNAPATNAPATNAPATNAPATNAPATNAPATNAPATNAPATNAPATNAPATNAPATDAPATEAPKTALSDDFTVTVTGDAKIGVELSAALTAVTKAAPSVTWKWQSATPVKDGEPVWADIADATAATYTIVATDEGKILRAVATAAEDDETYTGSVESAATAAVVDPNKVTVEADHTASSRWGANNPATKSVDSEDGLEYFNGDADTGWSGAAFAQFTIPSLGENEAIYSAQLSYKVTQNGNGTYSTMIYALTDGAIDLETLTGSNTDRFAEGRSGIIAQQDGMKKGDIDLSNDVTSALNYVTSNKLTLMLTGNGGSAQLHGTKSENPPKLILTKGVPVTFTVQAAASADTKVKDAVIEVKNGETVVATGKTSEEGTVTIVLPANKTFTYTVTSADYAIKKDGSVTTPALGTAADGQTVELAANVATSIEISAPASGTTIAAGESITYTATILDQDDREMTAEIDWEVTLDETSDEDEEVTIDGGVVTTTEDATGGAYTVKATVKGTDISDTEVLTISKVAKVNVSITAGENGTVSYTVNDVPSEDTQILPGKTIVATATANPWYGFVGWATSVENAGKKEYVQDAGAVYTFTTAESTDVTLIACFEYNGIYTEEFKNTDGGFTTGGFSASVVPGENYVTLVNTGRTSGDLNGIGGSGYYSNIKTLDEKIKEMKKVEVSYEFKSLCQSGNNRKSCLDLTSSDGTPIFGVHMQAGTRAGEAPTGYVYRIDALGGTASSSDSAFYAGAFDSSGDTTSVIVTLTLDFENQKLSGTITANGAELNVAIPETSITATDLGQIAATNKYSASPIALYNLTVKDLSVSN